MNSWYCSDILAGMLSLVKSPVPLNLNEAPISNIAPTNHTTNALDISRCLYEMSTGNSSAGDQSGPVPGLETPTDDDSFGVAEGGVTV